MAANISVSTEKWDYEVDIVIAGAGGAGIAAAIEAADLKANVLVLEKQPVIEDSSSSLCGGVYTFAGTDFQEKKGIKDSNDLFFNDLMKVGLQKNDEKLVRVYVDNQLDTYKWMTGFGVKWIGVEALAGMSVPRGHVTDPVDALQVLKKTAEKKGAEFMFETPVTGLITDAEKKVIGVTAKSKGKSLRIKAKKGVLLASGGFGRDPKRLATIDPRLPQVVPVVGPGHTGDGINMAEQLGAYLRDIEYVKPTFGIYYTSKENSGLMMLFYSGAIIVNKEGKRFIDESMSYKDLGKASLNQTEGIGIQVFDQKIYDVGVEKAKGLRADKALWGLDETRKKRLIQANTIEELAKKLSINPIVLKQTVDTYNKGVAAGKDPEFGRVAIAGGAGKITAIDTPPFYAYISKSLLPGTYGGIVVDENMQVLNRQGKIPGLYGAGEVVGGFHGASYMSGTAVGKAVIFGRVAARTMLKS